MNKFYKALLSTLIVWSCAHNLMAQQCDVIYCSPNGASGPGSGTRANPASLLYAIQNLVTPTSTRLHLAQGTYNTPAEIQLVNNLILEGGFDPVTWTKSNVPPTIIRRGNVIVLPPPANGTAVIAGLNVSGFRLQDLTLEMDVPNGVAATAYGIYLNGCSNYNIVRCNVTAADGTPGVAGQPGTPGQPGTAGNGQEAGRFVATPGGTGGSNGGNGAGNGGHSGSSNIASTAGAGPCGGGGGATGTGPQNSFFNPTPLCGNTTPGQPGQADGHRPLS
ncbi:MAG TPA: hypothetical protein PLW44_09765, partial [Chitinophagales bacterium]|nr:hypothetical protein [Chitinophagales bacterium]